MNHRRKRKNKTPDPLHLEAAAHNDDTIFFNVPVELTAAKGEGEAAKGPPTFEATVYNGGVMSPLIGGKVATVVVDLAKVNIPNKPVPVLRDHDPTRVVGHATAKLVDGNLVATGTISGTGDDAKEVVANAQNGFPWQLSMGSSVGQREFIAAGQSASINGRVIPGPYIAIRGGRLREISFTSLGADAETSARIAAHYAQGATMNFEQWLEAKGFTLAELSDAQKTSLKAMFDLDQQSAQAAGGESVMTAAGKKPARSVAAGDLDSVLGAERERETKRQKIVAVTTKALQDSPGQLEIIEAMSRQAMEGGWEPERYELELLRAMRPQATGRARHRDDEGLSGEVIEAALCMAGGLDKPEEHFSEQVLTAAEKRWNHGMGLNECLLFFARRNGFDGLSTRNVDPLLRAAFAPPRHDMLLAAASNSTMSLSGILANTANKFLKRGFDAVENTWRIIAARRSVRDFKQITSYSLTGDFKYEQVPAGGQLKHAKVGETTYTNQANTYGKMFGIDRRDIINDDLGALTAVPQRLGRGGALKFNEVFWTEFMDSSAIFPTDNSLANYLSGATPGTNDSRLGVEGLTRGETAFYNQTDPDGHPVAITPRILLVPNALAVTAMTLMNSMEIRDTTASTVFGTANPHTGKYIVARSSYLSNSAFTGYSTTAWYLLADPNDVPVIEVAFLNGVESPTVESADAEFQTLGIQMRGYHDFGVNMQEYRGAVKSKGAA